MGFYQFFNLFFFLPYLAVPILVHCEYHLTDLLCRDVEAPEDELQLLRRHAALGVLVEHAKCFLNSVKRSDHLFFF